MGIKEGEEKDERKICTKEVHTKKNNLKNICSFKEERVLVL